MSDQQKAKEFGQGMVTGVLLSVIIAMALAVMLA
jgi:hypothetical protein